jgi:predicted transposase YdaD
MEGRAEGRMEGRMEGRAEALAEALLRVLRVRGLVVSDEQRGRAVGCADLEVLARWLDRAATAGSVDDVFAD